MLDNVLIVILLFGCATWRLSYMLVHERGPFNIFVSVRIFFGIEHTEDFEPLGYPDTLFGNLFSCVYCMSVWVSFVWVVLVFLLPASVTIAMSLPFSISAVAVLIDTYVSGR